jgi:hypothetical protein
MKESNMFQSMHKVPFGRRGSYMVFFLEDLAEEEFGMRSSGSVPAAAAQAFRAGTRIC